MERKLELNPPPTVLAEPHKLIRHLPQDRPLHHHPLDRLWHLDIVGIQRPIIRSRKME